MKIHSFHLLPNMLLFPPVWFSRESMSSGNTVFFSGGPKHNVMRDQVFELKAVNLAAPGTDSNSSSN